MDECGVVMILFHLWLGCPLPDNLKKNIERSHNALSEGDRHVLFSDSIVECCEQVSETKVWAKIYGDGMFHRLIGDYIHSYNNGMMQSYTNVEMAVSDAIRFILAAELGDCMYADCDCIVKNVPICDDDKLLAPSNISLNNKYDIFVMRFGKGLGPVVLNELRKIKDGPTTKSAIMLINAMHGMNPWLIDKDCYEHPVVE